MPERFYVWSTRKACGNFEHLVSYPLWKSIDKSPKHQKQKDFVQCVCTKPGDFILFHKNRCLNTFFLNWWKYIYSYIYTHICNHYYICVHVYVYVLVYVYAISPIRSFPESPFLIHLKDCYLGKVVFQKKKKKMMNMSFNI